MKHSWQPAGKRSVNESMKICILSMQHVDNFGSVLQAYALKGMLEQLGHQVTFLPIEPSREDNSLRSDACMTFSGEGEDARTLLHKLKKLDRYTLNRVWLKYRWLCQRREFERFRSRYLPEADKNDRYDCCVIGSDEVFNCLTDAPWGFTGQLFGDVPQADKVITYAASCGSTLPEKVPEPALRRIQSAMKNLSALSVRDENTRAFAEHLSQLPVQQHPDPALVADFSREMAETKLPESLPERYCIVYSYYNRIKDGEEIRRIREFCAQQKLALLTVGAPQKWIPKHLVLTPFEMLKVFQNADFVITDTFHGTIFSAKYAKRFAVLIRGSNRNKLGDLVARLDLAQHVVESFGDLEQAYSVNSETEKTGNLTGREYDRTMAYLSGNIMDQ